jgi:uncharacterized membrane protein
MSETPASAAGSTGGSRPLDYMTNGTIQPGGSGLLRLGGALGIAACVVGIIILLTACAGFGKVIVLSMIPVALSLPGLVLSIVGAIVQKQAVTEDTHVLHALFANMMGLIGGLLEMAAWLHWPVFHH